MSKKSAKTFNSIKQKWKNDEERLEKIRNKKDLKRKIKEVEKND